MIHAPTGRRLKYGGTGRRRSQDTGACDVALKSPGEFKLIGTPAKRLDIPARSTARPNMASTRARPA